MIRNHGCIKDLLINRDIMTSTKFHCAKCDIVVNSPDAGIQPVIPKGWKYGRIKNCLALLCDKC